jgi:hypothetical protein
MDIRSSIIKILKEEGIISNQENRDNDELNVNYDFNSSTYNSDDKSVVAAYMIIDETEKMIEVMNIKEFEKTSSIYADNSKPYHIVVERVRLPKSQIDVLEEVEGKEGFYYIKIPYWLFKKNSNELEIERIIGKKRITISSRELRDNGFRQDINDPNVQKYISISDPDEMTNRILKNDARRYKPE